MFNITRSLFRANNQLVRSQLATRFSAAFYSIDSKKLEDITKNNKVVIFMKGNPENPKCGFSNAVVQILRMHGVKYDSHDVLSDEDLRQGKKVNKETGF